MQDPRDDLNEDEKRLSSRIDEILREMLTLMEADYIRLWRYVDSQKVIFGFRWFAPSGRDYTQEKSFENYVGFRKRNLQTSGIFTRIELGETGEHPYWHFPEPEPAELGRSGREFLEVVLARSDQEHDLDALLCAGTSFSAWGHISIDKHRMDTIHRHLTELHSLVQLYSLHRFYSAFIVGGEARPWPQSLFLDVSQPQTPERMLVTLAETLADGVHSTESFYLRNLDLTLYAGVGAFYERLKAFEDPEDGDALQDEGYRDALITGYVMRNVKHGHPAPEPMLFPGSPDARTYEAIRVGFGRWVEIVNRRSLQMPAAKRHGEWLSNEFANIGRSGSFGVFPVYAEDIRSTQAFLCVASAQRNFFRWRARIAIEDACQWFSHNLPAARPLRNLLRRVNDDVATSLRSRKDFQDQLCPRPIQQSRDRVRSRRRTDRGSKSNIYLKKVQAFVMSVDIRRSTQLMRDTLRADEYAAFLINLSRDLAEEVKGNYGIFDKFTGDGILACFPIPIFANDAHSAALWTIAAAEHCHERFEQLFMTLRPHLAIVEEPQGLGIGIDFGDVSLVDVNGELTMVGIPVVYACRLATAPAGVTLLNEQAYQQLKSQRGCGEFDELTLPTKDRKMRARIVPRFWSQGSLLPRKFYWTE